MDGGGRTEMLERKKYANGQDVFTCSDDTLTYYFKNGRVKAQGRFIDDRMEGEWHFYRESGQLWQVGHLQNGEKHGSWIRFDKHDQVEYHETFSDGKIVKR